MDSAAEVVRNYLKAWDHKDAEGVRRHFADDVRFKGPMVEVQGADAVVRSAANMFPILKGVEVRDIAVASGDVVVAIYDFVCAEPVGACRTAERCVVRDGVIAETELFFDPRPFIAFKAARSPH